MNPYVYQPLHRAAWERIHALHVRPASITDAELELLIDTTLEVRHPQYDYERQGWRG